MVSNSKCKKCDKVLNVMELQDNPDGVGKVCIDEVDCKKHQEKEKCLVHQIDDKRS